MVFDSVLAGDNNDFARNSEIAVDGIDMLMWQRAGYDETSPSTMNAMNETVLVRKFSPKSNYLFAETIYTYRS